MHAHTITYTNFNGEEKTKVINFNLTEAELTKLQKDYLHDGGINAVMDRAVQSGDTKQLLDFFELLVHRSYGVKSADGEEFDKSEEMMRRFENQAFYSDLYMSFFGDDGKIGQAFIRAVMPTDLIAKAEANVRGEGEIDKAAERARLAQNLRPDARDIAQQARENLKDHLVVIEDRNYEAGTQNIFEAATERETSVAPVVVTPPVSTDFRVAEEESPVMTRRQWEEQQATRRPPHEATEQSLNGL